MNITNYLTNCVNNHTPVSFSKFGDGEFNCIMKSHGKNCDNDCYTEKLSKTLLYSFKYLVEEVENAYIGLWHNQDNKSILEKIVNKQVKWVNYHSIIFDKTNDDEKVALFKSIKNSKVKKIIICNELLIKSKLLFNADEIILVNFNNWFDNDFENIMNKIKKLIIDNENHIIITCCGMSFKNIICECHKIFENGIYLDFGSAIDLLCSKKDSRGYFIYSIDYQYLITKLEEILPEEWNHNKFNYIYEQAKYKLGVHIPIDLTIYKKNLVFISSVIHTPNLPFSYINTRSIYSHKDRFEQTKKTINSIRNKIPDSIIFIVECSPLEEEEKEYLTNYSDIFINLYDLNNQDLINKIYSRSKSLGEGTITLYVLNYLIENNIDYNDFFKISGRYWLNDNFNYRDFNNDCIVTKKINNDDTNFITSLYKLPNKIIPGWFNFLTNSSNDMNNCIGAECIFANFVNSLQDEKIFVEKIGISGNIAVSGDFIDE